MARATKSYAMLERLDEPNVVALRSEAQRLSRGLGGGRVTVYPLSQTGRYRAHVSVGRVLLAEGSDPAVVLTDIVSQLRAEATERRRNLDSLLSEGGAA